MNTTSNALVTITDGFSDTDPTASPIRGLSVRFKDGHYLSFGDKLDVKNKSYACIDRVAGWQMLQRDCEPQYLMRQPGEPKPPQPQVPKENWPLDLNGQPQHPWRWTDYLYLVDVTTGEFSTFSSSTTGGHIAVRELSDQVSLMRNVRPNAIPIVALESKDMPTQFGSTKPRPFFRLIGWKTRDAEQPQLVDMAKPTSEQVMQDEVPYNDPLPSDLSAPKTATKKKKK
jgi:hypothetical protein